MLPVFLRRLNDSLPLWERFRSRYFDRHVRVLIFAVRHVRVPRQLLRLRELCRVGDALAVRRPSDWKARRARLYRHVLRRAGHPDVSAADSDELAVLAAESLRALAEPLMSASQSGLCLVLNALALISAVLLCLSLASSALKVRLFPVDLAATAKWSVSSTFPGTQASGVGTSSKGPYFFHTQFENEPWLVVDFGRPVHVGRIKIFNRVDCCQERELPLNVESPKGNGWNLVCQRRSPFHTWTCEPHDLTTDRIRLRLPGNTALHLERVEVWR